MQVLLVDDDQELVSVLADRLSFRGIDAEWVSNAEDALKNIYAKEYDVALLYVKMPGMNGVELAQEIHNHRPGLKIIFVTGHGFRTDLEEGADQSGNNFFLARPVDINELIKKIKEVRGQ